MKRTVKVGLSVALIWIIITMIIFYAGYSQEAFEIGILVNVFCLLCAISAGLYLHKRDIEFQKESFANDFKSCMQSGMIYALIVAGFVYLYHEYIDSSIKDGIVNARIAAVHEMVPDQTAFEELAKDDDTWRDKSYDDYIENQEDIVRSVVSSFSVFIFHLAGLFFFAIFYSFFTTVILRKVVLRH